MDKSSSKFKNIKTMAKSSQIIFSRDVIHTISKEAELIRNNETGGLLFGNKGDKIITITYCTGTEYCEVQQPAYLRFIPEIETVLNKIVNDTSLDFIGIWHIHPTGLNRSSQGDLHSFRGILKDNKDLQFLVSVIVQRNPSTKLISQQNISLYCYLINMQEDLPIKYRVEDSSFQKQSIDEFLSLSTTFKKLENQKDNGNLPSVLSLPDDIQKCIIVDNKIMKSRFPEFQLKTKEHNGKKVIFWDGIIGSIRVVVKYPTTSCEKITISTKPKIESDLFYLERNFVQNKANAPNIIVDLMSLFHFKEPTKLIFEQKRPISTEYQDDLSIISLHKGSENKEDPKESVKDVFKSKSIKTPISNDMDKKSEPIQSIKKIKHQEGLDSTEKQEKALIKKVSLLNASKTKESDSNERKSN